MFLKRLSELLSLSLFALFFASPALSQSAWLKAETPRFTIYSVGSEKNLRAYAERIELMDATFWEVYGLPRPPPSRKLPIYLVGKPDDLRLVSPDLDNGVVGFYSAGSREIFAMGLAGRDNDYILLHEYAHHLMKQHFPFGYPAWLVEGYAEYFMSATVDEAAIKVGLAPGRVYELSSSPWLPMETVLTKRVSDIPKSQRSVFYAQSWLLTHYMISDQARALQLQAYLTAIGQGQDPLVAMKAATGLETVAWERRLRTYGGGQMRYLQFNRSQFEKAPVEITRLPVSATDLLLDDLHVKTGVSTELQSELLGQIRGKAGRYPDDRSAQFALARAEVELGDKKVGGDILKRRLVANPNDVEALALEADRLMALGQESTVERAELYNQAGTLLAKAFKLEPGRYQTLLEFARSRSGETNYPSDNTLTAILTALKLAPQVDETRLLAAQGLMRRARSKEAAIILAPLANSPHDSAEAKQARELLAEINKVVDGKTTGAM